MKLLHSLSLLSASLLPSALAGPVHVRTALEYRTFTQRQLNLTQAERELGSQLSSHASIYGPSDVEWYNITERWDTYAAPVIQLVVVPGTEADVPVIVCQLSCSFCAYSC